MPDFASIQTHKKTERYSLDHALAMPSPALFQSVLAGPKYLTVVAHHTTTLSISDLYLSFWNSSKLGFLEIATFRPEAYNHDSV